MNEYWVSGLVYSRTQHGDNAGFLVWGESTDDAIEKAIDHFDDMGKDFQVTAVSIQYQQ